MKEGPSSNFKRKEKEWRALARVTEAPEVSLERDMREA